MRVHGGLVLFALASASGASAGAAPRSDVVAAAFRASHGAIEVKATYGASGNFFAQIVNGAPFDLFLSADTEFAARLVEKGHADGKAFTYAYGKLVAWVPNGSQLDLAARGLAAVTDPSVQKIAIANP